MSKPLTLTEVKAIVLAANPSAAFVENSGGIYFTDTELEVWDDGETSKLSKVHLYLTCDNTFYRWGGVDSIWASARAPKKRLRTAEECLGKWVRSPGGDWALVIGTMGEEVLFQHHERTVHGLYSSTLHDTPNGPDIGWEVDE